MPTSIQKLDSVRIFRALGHRARLRMVLELGRGERCVADLVAHVGLSFATVSRHLAGLRDAGIVESEKRATQVFYSLALPCVIDFTACLEGTSPRGAPAGRGCCP